MPVWPGGNLTNSGLKSQPRRTWSESAASFASPWNRRRCFIIRSASRRHWRSPGQCRSINPASKTFGNFHWRHDQAEVLDRNAVEFSMLQCGLLHLRFASALSPKALSQLNQLMTDGVKGMELHKVGLDYTNIYLTKTWNLIAAGESLGRPEVAGEGYRQLEEWLRFTATHGITEYNAVTYYGIDMEALALIARHAARPEGRKQAELALSYFWTDLAANWWQSGDRMGGANARSYDYLYGRGYTESRTWAAGWLRTRPQLEGAGR